MVDDNQRRRYSLNGSSGNPKPAAPVAGPKAPAAPAKPVNTSSFLTRIANTAIRESGAPAGAPVSAANPRWMQIDHSSPAANLNSRLRWVENAFKTSAPTQAQQQQAPQVPTQSAQHAQAAVPAQHSIAAAPDLKTAVLLMRKRLLSIHEQIVAFDCELAEIEKKL